MLAFERARLDRLSGLCGARRAPGLPECRPMTWLLYPLAVAAGLAAPVQFAVNSQLRNYVGGPVAAAAISFLVGSIVLVVAAAPTVGRIHGGRIAGAPWWVWTGGLLGAAYIVCSIVLTPRLGAGTTVVLFIAGNLLGSMLLDQFGLLRLPVHHAGWPRILGAALVFAGAVLVQRF